MSLKLNNINIEGMKLNNHKVIGGMLNGQTLFTFEGTPYMSFRINTSIFGDTSYTIPFYFGNYGSNLTNISILWGDGNQTVITDGNITSTLCTHNYESSGEFDIFIYSYNGKIPTITGFGQNVDSPLVSMNNPILSMIDVNGGNASESVFNDFFYECTRLQNIPKNLFSLNAYATKFEGTFSQCLYLTEIPSDLFKYNINVTSFKDCFYQCRSISSIPTNLFRYNTLVNNFERCFYGCSGISLIPEDLFKYITVNLVDLSGCFSEIGINSIPNNLFYNLGEKLYSVASIFENCSSLNVLNYNIFSNNINLIFLSRAFYGTSIVSIPSGFFDNNTVASDFSYCFSNCSLLETIPEYLFRITSYAAATDFNYCFSECPKLKLISNIFCDEETEVNIRFLNKNIDFTGCFSRSSFSGTQGIAPQLWNYTYGTVTSSNCFSGNGNSYNSLSNYYIIPESWGGPYKDNSMTFVIDTTKVSDTNKNFSLPFYAGTYSNIGSLSINWGDGNATSITNKIITDSNRTHTYTNAGIYSITITSSNGSIPFFQTNLPDNDFYEERLNDCLQITRIETPLLHMYNMYDQYDEESRDKESTILRGTFSWCKNLDYVYEGVFDKNIQAIELIGTFYRCESITSINSRWFKNIINVNNLGNVFAYSGIQEIPSDLLNKMVSLNYINGLFQGCFNLVSIGEDLFKSCSLLESISSAFAECNSLTKIPTDLFKYNIELTEVADTFLGCTSLISVPEYLFKYNTKIFDFSGLFSGCTNLIINKNIFCNESTEMDTRFATGDIEVGINPSYSNMTFNNTFFGVSNGEAPQLWNYTYKINVDNTYTGEKYIINYPNGNDCFEKTGYKGTSFNNNLLNYPLIPSMWGGEYIINTMSFEIDTSKISNNNKFILPFNFGSYIGLDNITIDWGDTTYNARNVIVGDNLSGAKLTFNFPDNLYQSLPVGYGKSIIKSADNYNIVDIYSGYGSWDGGYNGSINYNTDGALILLTEESEDDSLYSAYYDNGNVVTKDSSAEFSYSDREILVTDIDITNAAYQYIKINIPNNQTIITDGNITEELCTHNYSSPGIYTVTIKSSNNKIPYMTNTSLLYGVRLITSLNNTILHMINKDGSDVNSINNLFESASITKIPSSLFYYNRHINNISNLFSGTKIVDIPKGIFDYIPELINVSGCFYNCTDLTNIPEELFKNNNLITNFRSCFYGCFSLTSIPEMLFSNNTIANDFSNCFYGCSSLISIGSNLFCNENTEKHTRFATLNINFSNCFKNAGSLTNTTTLPDLWNYTYYLVNSAGCFSDFRGSPTNLDDIPIGWGGSNTFIKLNIDTAKEDSNDYSFIVPFEIGNYSMRLRYITIDWGDTTSTTLFQNITEELCTHNYSSPGIYTVTIKDSTNGYMPKFNFGNYSDINASKLLSIEGTLYKMGNRDEDISYTELGDTIDIVNFDYMFSGCSNLNNVSSSLLILNKKDETNNIYPTAIRMFENSGIRALEDNFFVSNINDFNACFYNCNRLIKSPCMRNASNYNSCFYGCSALQELPENLFQWRGQSSGENKKFNFCFANCIHLVSIPEGLFSFTDEIGLDEFTGCFNGCINLTTIPDNLFASANSISYSMCFEGCNKLKINQNIFGESTTKFGSLEDNQIVDMSNMFSLTSFSGIKGTAPQLWNYLYAPSNYINLFTQSSPSTETKSGVEATYNIDSSITLNGSLSAQSDFSSSNFNFVVSNSKIYNICLSHEGGSVTSSSTYIIRMQILNYSTDTLYYSKMFSSLDDLNKWEGVKFDSSILANCKIVLRLYAGTTYDNLIIKPRISEAKINCSECFNGHSLNSLTNYNDIPSYWK